MVLGGQHLDYKMLCRLPFGAYVQVHDDRLINNDLEPRTIGAINLGPTGNIQGPHRFMSLVTGEIIVRRTWTELPIPSEVLIRMEELPIDPYDDTTNFDMEDQGDNNEEEHNVQNEGELNMEERQNIEEEHNINMNEENGEQPNLETDVEDDPDVPTLRKMTLDTSVTDSTAVTSNVSHMNSTTEIINHGYNLRQNCTRD
jgi:hypothetical protein